MARYLSPLDIWAIAFGCMIGWGAFVMPGTTFLPIAGPAGTVIALALSTVIILIIGRNYSFLMNMQPGTGGVYAYTKEAFGRDHAFLCSWFLSLSYLTIVFLNATALFVISRTALGNVCQVGLHYQVAGYNVYLGEIALSASVLIVIGMLFILGKPVLQRLQTILAVILFAGIAIISIATIPHVDPVQLLQFSDKGAASSTTAMFSIVLFAPWAFVGFDVVALETAHFRFPMNKAGRIIAISIILAGLAYISLAVSSISYVPPEYASWRDYMAHLDEIVGMMSVPVFYAARETMGAFGVVVIIVTALASILTGIVGAARASIRMLSTMAEDKILSEEFLGTTFCVLFIVGISIVISFLGRNALNWFVELTSFGATVGYAYTSAAAAKLARAQGVARTWIAGVAGTAISGVFAAVQLLSKVGPLDAMSGPSYLLLAVWCLLGFLFYWRTMRQSVLTDFNGASASSIILFCLLFYCILMWFTESAMALASTQSMQVQLARDIAVLVLFSGVGLAGMVYIQRLLSKRQRMLERDMIHAEESSKAKSQFLFNMSHDIRTPMNAIIGYTRLIGEQEDLRPETREYAEMIDTSSRQLLLLIDDILEMSRIESGKLELVLEPVDLHQLLRETEDMFALQMQEKDIRFVVDSSGIEENWVVCDGTHLSRVFQNLLSNAYKFTPSGGTVKLAMRQIEGGGEGMCRYEIRVKDSGIGMSAEFTEKLFNAFERERTSTISGTLGTGLGLAITKNIVDKMGGTIEVQTAPNQGTEFTVLVSFEAAPETDRIEATQPEEAEEEEETRAFDFSDIRLLLVEDNEINRIIMSKTLESWGAQVDIAENGLIAIETLTSQEPGTFDAILMDIQMPVMDGYTATERIRELPDEQLSRIPIIAVTANAFGEDVLKAESVGMDAHVSKPIDSQKLMDTLTHVLENA